MIPDCTLVTANYCLTKYHNKCRDFETTINHMKSLLEVPCYMVIFTDSYSFPKINEIRSNFNLNHLTKYIVREFEELEMYKYIETVKENREKYYPTKDERTCAESHLLCCSKFDFVLETIQENPFQTSKFAWIDTYVGTNFSRICTHYKNNTLLKILNNITDKFHIQVLNVCDKKYIQMENLREYYEHYRWVACGGFFTTGKEIGLKILNELKQIFIKHTNAGYGHGEEMFYLEILDKYYDDSIHISYGDYQFILDNFISPTINIHYIYYFIILNYIKFGYYKECYDCCKRILHEYESYNIEMDYFLYFNILFQYYLCCFNYKREEAFDHVNKIYKLIEINPNVKNIYNQNKEFYDTQFSFVKN